MDDWLKTFGYATGDPTKPYAITTSTDSLVVSILSAGTFFGALASAPLSDFLGRRWVRIETPNDRFFTKSLFVFRVLSLHVYFFPLVLRCKQHPLLSHSLLPAVYLLDWVLESPQQSFLCINRNGKRLPSRA